VSPVATAINLDPPAELNQGAGEHQIVAGSPGLQTSSRHAPEFFPPPDIEPRDVAGQLRASETVDGPDLVDDHSATSDSDAVPARACQDSDPPR